MDILKNQFDSGLWQKGRQEQERYEGVKAFSSDLGGGVEVFNRYLRVGSAAPIEEQRFMAKIVIDGVTYTTNRSSGIGDSFVGITPTVPYVLNVSDFVDYHDQDAFFSRYDADVYIDVDVYYFKAPDGIRILFNRGLDRPLRVDDDGYSFSTSFVVKYPVTGSGGWITFRYSKVGIVLGKDDIDEPLRVSDIHRGLGATDPVVHYNQVSTGFRVVKLWTDVPITLGDTKSPFRIFDNFGCEHVFYIEQNEQGKSMRLKDA